MKPRLDGPHDPNDGAHKAHLIGIGGVGMSAVATLLLEAGWEVTGSEEGLYPPTSTMLEQLGLMVRTPYQAKNIPTDTSLILIGKHARLHDKNPEVRAALASGAEIKSFPQVLSSFMGRARRLVVAGTHGKSSTTALLTLLLTATGHRPGYFIGAVLDNMPSARLGGGEVFVAEGDEYPSSNLDPTPKFLHLKPDVVLLTSATLDHIDVYESQEEYLDEFKRLISTLPSDGLLVFCEECPYATELALEAPCRTVAYGVSRGTYFAGNAKWSRRISFQLRRNDENLTHLRSRLFGRHNLQNFIGASALLIEEGLARPTDLEDPIVRFHLPKRRLTQHSSRVFEDIASSPTKLKASISALRHRFPANRLVVLFEPYSRTWRHPRILQQLPEAFRLVHEVVLTNPRALGNAPNVEELPIQCIADVLDEAGIPTRVAGQGDALADLIKGDLCGSSDIVAVVTSGDASELLQLVLSPSP